MLVQRRRRWTNIKPALIQGVVFTTQHLEPMLIYCWFSVVDGGPTLNQHWFRVLCWDITANTTPRTNADLMLVQRRRRWTNIKPALIQSVVFAGIGVFSDIIYPQDLPRPSRRTSPGSIRSIPALDLWPLYNVCSPSKPNSSNCPL